VSTMIRSVVGRQSEPLVFSARAARREAQAACPIGGSVAATGGRGLRARWSLVDSLAAGVSGRLQSGAHSASRLPEPALGHPRSRRRLPAPGAQAGATTPRGLKKRKDLIREMVDSGAELLREGGSHTIFRSRTGMLVPVPRHAEIGEGLARKIVRDAKR